MLLHPTIRMSSINPDMMKYASLKGADDAMFFTSGPAEISCYYLLSFLPCKFVSSLNGSGAVSGIARRRQDFASCDE